MLAVGLPIWILGCVAYVKDTTGSDQYLDGTEFFAGEALYTRTMVEANLEYRSFEIRHDASEDMLSDEGWLKALSNIVHTKCDGLNHWGPPCSSWVFINRWTSGRTAQNPLGNEARRYVRDANTMTSRMVVLLLVSVILGQHFLLEQPLTTILHLHYRMRWLLHVLKWYVLEIHTYMGAFGASSPKPSRLFGTPYWIAELIQKIKKGTKFSNKKVSVRYYNKKGKRSVTGGPGLKQTQQYPKGYCRKVCQLYLKHRAGNKLTIDLDKLEKIPKKKDLWRDVKLKSLLLSLQRAGYFPPHGTRFSELFVE